MYRCFINGFNEFNHPNMSTVFSINEQGHKTPISIHEVLFDPENNAIPIGNRLGISYLRSQEEELEIFVGDLKVCLQQSNVGMMGISTVIWDAGLLLVDFLHTVHKVDSEVWKSIDTTQFTLGHVLELGCGTGIGGLVCYILGAETAILSDMQFTSVLQDNITTVKNLSSIVDGNRQVEFIQHDWSNKTIPPSILTPPRDGDIWDTIICSDVLYESKNHTTFMGLLRRLQFKKLVLSYKCRHTEEESAFLQELSTWCLLYFIQNSAIHMRNLKDTSCAGLMIIVCVPLIAT